MAATNPIAPQSGYNNISTGWLTPLVTADGILVSNNQSYPSSGSTFFHFDSANSRIKFDDVTEYTSSAGIAIANNIPLRWKKSGGTKQSVVKLNSSDKLDFDSSFDLNFQTFTPSAYGGTGSLTFTSVTPSNNFYLIIGDLLYLHFRATGTTGGTTSSELTWDLPGGLTAQAGNLELACSVFENSGNSKPGRCYAVSGTQFRVSKYDVSNFTLAANSGFIVQGLLRLA